MLVSFKLFRHGLRRLALAALLPGATGCAVYVPTIPATPLITKGQAELTGDVRSLISAEVGAAYAPTNHLLISAESGFQSSEGSMDNPPNQLSYHDYHRQVGLGLGYYRAPAAAGQPYWAALVGVGFASTVVHALDFKVPSPYLPFPFPYYVGRYDAQYLRYYGQVYVALPASGGPTFGASLRGTVVDYTHLTLDDVAIAPTNRVFLEPTVFLRAGQGALRGFATVGFSLPVNGNSSNPINARTAPWSGLVGAGLVLRPDLLWTPKTQ